GRIFAAVRLKECRATTRHLIEKRVKDLFDTLPLLRRHGRRPAISPCSHACATSQSRFTVFVDTPSVLAISSASSPPKNRNSTTWLCLGSISASPVRASSKATRSAHCFRGELR